MKIIPISLTFLVLLCAGCAVPQPKTEVYSVVTCQVGDASYDAIKWNRVTGKAYLLRGQAWMKIHEADRNAMLQKGSYDVQFIPLLNDWGAIRINAETGETWTMSSGQWVANLTEPTPATQQMPPVVNDAAPVESASVEADDDTVPEDAAN